MKLNEGAVTVTTLYLECGHLKWTVTPASGGEIPEIWHCEICQLHVAENIDMRVIAYGKTRIREPGPRVIGVPKNILTQVVETNARLLGHCPRCGRRLTKGGLCAGTQYEPGGCGMQVTDDTTSLPATGGGAPCA